MIKNANNIEYLTNTANGGNHEAQYTLVIFCCEEDARFQKSHWLSHEIC